MDSVAQRMHIVDLVIGINSMIFSTDVLKSQQQQQQREEVCTYDKNDFLAYRISVHRIQTVGILLGYIQKHRPVVGLGLDSFIAFCQSVIGNDMQREPRIPCKRYRDGSQWFHIRHPVHFIACQLYPKVFHKLRRYRNLRRSCNQHLQLLLSKNIK